MIEFLSDRFNRLYNQAHRNNPRINLRYISYQLSCSEQLIHYFRSGERRITRDFADKIADIFNLTKEEFLNNTIQVFGTYQFVNFSHVPIHQVKKTSEVYKGLTEEEVMTILEFKSIPNWEDLIKKYVVKS